MAHYEPWSVERAAEIIRGSQALAGATLPILHDLQHAFGFVPDAAIPMIAEALNLSRAEVFGTVTFYHEFRRELPGRHVLKLCQAEACQANGSDLLRERAEKRLGVKLGETTPDRRVTIEPIYCLGLCANGPSAQFDERMVGRVTEARLDALLAEAQS
jgi:formate dehydrogenase subunit gamma